MAFSKVISGVALAALTMVLAACGGEATSEGETAVAAGPEPEVIDARQANFKAIGKSCKAIRTQLEGASPDTAAIAAAATDLNGYALLMDEHFPEGTSVEDGYDTEALAVIWEKTDEFTEAKARLVQASADMITIAEAGDVAAIGDQVGAIGGSCKNCHDNFRLDTD